MDDAERKLHLKILTPMKVVFDEPVDMVIVRTTDGDLGVMYGREACSALLGDGVLRVIPDRREKEQELFMILGGILAVRENHAIVTSDVAEHPDTLQAYLDRLTEEREESIRKERIADLQASRLEQAIRQALVHVDINPYSSIDTPGRKVQKNDD